MNCPKGAKLIPLTQGQSTIVDGEDYEWLNQWKWYAWWNKHTKSFYAVRNSKRKNGKQHPIYMARLILYLKKGDKQQADHINHVTLDNCRLNLRRVTNQQNTWNTKKTKGYSLHNKKFRVRIGLNGKNIYLGRFRTTKEARNAYLIAKKKYHIL